MRKQAGAIFVLSSFKDDGEVLPHALLANLRALCGDSTRVVEAPFDEHNNREAILNLTQECDVGVVLLTKQIVKQASFRDVFSALVAQHKDEHVHVLVHTIDELSSIDISFLQECTTSSSVELNLTPNRDLEERKELAQRAIVRAWAGPHLRYVQKLIQQDSLPRERVVWAWFRSVGANTPFPAGAGEGGDSITSLLFSLAERDLEFGSVHGGYLDNFSTMLRGLLRKRKIIRYSAITLVLVGLVFFVMYRVL